MASLTDDAVNAGTLLNTNFSSSFGTNTEISVNDISSNIYYTVLNLYYDTEYYAYRIKTYLFN